MRGVRGVRTAARVIAVTRRRRDKTNTEIEDECADTVGFFEAIDAANVRMRA